MKTFSILIIVLLLILMGCGQSTSEDAKNEEASPGPVTESDKNRYNINPNEEVVYGTMDSVMQDSIQQDSINKNP